IWVLMLV
ncbi:hypothetical protein MIMGU_mgv11b0121612mg, partial [Erythranthe guttata]